MNYKKNYYINNANKNKEVTERGDNKGNFIKLNILNTKKNKIKKEKD